MPGRPSLRFAAAACLAATLAGCGAMVHVATEAADSRGPGPDDAARVDLALRTDGIGVSISNLGTAPLYVLWDRSAITDTDGATFGVVHSAMVEWAAPDRPGDVSRVVPHATLNTVIVPTRCVRFDPDYGWIVEPLLPVECGPLRCIGYHELVGAEVAVRLVLEIDGHERPFEWTLRITQAVRSSRGTRPDDPNLH